MPVPSLAELRLAIGRKGVPLRQMELAAAANLSQSYLSQLEAGVKKPSPYMLARLAVALDMPLDELHRSVRETLRRHKIGQAQIRTSF